MSGIKKYMTEDTYLNDMEKAYELVDEDDYEYYDDSFDDYDDDFDYPEVENKIEQFYGVDGNGTPRYVAMSKEQVQKFAKAHPEEDIVRVESSSGMRFNLYEALKAFDKKQFRENASSCELEMLYESVRDTLSAQQKNDLAKFVRKARTAEEINTYMTGMLAKAANESLEESRLVESPNEDVDEATFNKLKEIAYELDEYIEDKVWVRDFWYDAQFDNTISFEIYGDWKHDHARFRYYASEWLDNKGLKYKMWETITDDDGSDSYGATHTIRLYDIAEESTVEEGYISQGNPQEQPEVEPDKFSNGRLRDFDPYPFMKKIMNSGKSMNSIRTLGDDYYTIFVSYMNHFGPKGIDDKDTRYSLDIIKETPDGEQTRDLFERDLLWNEVAEKLSDWRQDKVTENPLAESIAQLNEAYPYRKVEKAILQAISDIGGECFETIDNDSCSYRFEGKVSRKALITNLSDALKSTGYTILSDNSGVEVQDNDNWWQGTNIEIYNDTDNQEKGYSFFIIGIYDLS